MSGVRNVRRQTEASTGNDAVPWSCRADWCGDRETWLNGFLQRAAIVSADCLAQRESFRIGSRGGHYLQGIGDGLTLA